MNAVNLETQQELSKSWAEFREDPDVWVAIISGAGDEAFSAGADLKEMGQSPDVLGSWDDVLPTVPSALLGAMEVWKPTIAAINGYALGMGCTIALSYDIRIAAENAPFSYPEVAREVSVSLGSLLLPRLIPLGLAIEMLLTGDIIDSEEVYRLGLVNKVVALLELMSAAEKTTKRLCENPPLAVRATRKYVIRGREMLFDQGRSRGCC